MNQFCHSVKPTAAFILPVHFIKKKKIHTHTYVVTFRTFVEHARSLLDIHCLVYFPYVGGQKSAIRGPDQFQVSHCLGNSVLMVPHAHTW